MRAIARRLYDLLLLDADVLVCPVFSGLEHPCWPAWQCQASLW